jgi:hypothetical protein
MSAATVTDRYTFIAFRNGTVSTASLALAQVEGLRRWDWRKLLSLGGLPDPEAQMCDTSALDPAHEFQLDPRTR